jgi:ABC-2 type transport system permease protein
MKEFVVAEKEFRDILSSKRFLAVFAILLVLCIIGMISGLASYNQQLDQYKVAEEKAAADPGTQQQIEQMQQQLQQMKSSGSPQTDIDNQEFMIQNMQAGGYQLPSMTTIFYSITDPFYMVGMALAIAMGFDLISREIDSGSLKSLLSHPIFRDSIINGKAIAAIVSLAMAVAATFLVIFAIMMFSGVTPQGDDLARVLTLFGVTVLYCIAFLGVSIMISTLVKNSTMSILCVLGIFLVAYSLPMVSGQVADFISGPQPQMPPSVSQINAMPNSSVTIGNQTYTADQVQQYNNNAETRNQIEQWQYQNESAAYFQKEEMIQDAIEIVSPMSDYQNLQDAILNNHQQINPFSSEMMQPFETEQTVSLWTSVSPYWDNILALIIAIILTFAISYVAFMRMDIK